MTHGSLFSGIGGFDLAAEWAGIKNVFTVENDEFCNKVLEKNFPNTKKHGNIYEFDGTKYRGQIDIISGGFPCQPFSLAGQRKGTEDDRHLWPEMLRIIREANPEWVIGENVAGILSVDGGMVIEQVLLDLEDAGYEVMPPFVIPACAVVIGALHPAAPKTDIYYIIRINGKSRYFTAVRPFNAPEVILRLGRVRRQ